MRKHRNGFVAIDFVVALENKEITDPAVICALLSAKEWMLLPLPEDDPQHQTFVDRKLSDADGFVSQYISEVKSRIKSEIGPRSK